MFIPSVDFSTHRSMFGYYGFHVSSVLSSIVTTSREEEEAGRYAGHLLVSTFCGLKFYFCSSSCQRRTVILDCGSLTAGHCTQYYRTAPVCWDWPENSGLDELNLAEREN